MRTTIRFNKEEEAKLRQLQAIIGVDEPSTALKFAIDWTLNHINIVTEALISPNWEVYFQRKNKTSQAKKRLYFR